MKSQRKIATIFGGTGFVGRQIVREMAAKGILVKVATRIPESAYFLKPCGDVGQIVPVACNYKDETSIDAAIMGSDYVVNCIGILFEKRKKQNFDFAHVEIPGLIAKACEKHNVKKFVHISALACERGTSKYASSKVEGEQIILRSFETATILRPSIIFGEDDNFFNMFARLAQIFPVLPLIGGGKTKFQPIYVGDVADAAIASLMRTETEGKIYELGGPEVKTFRELLELMFSYTGRQRNLISLPFCVAKAEASILSLFPKPLLTTDQVESLKTDNIVSDTAFKLYDLEITPTSLDLILPNYLERYRAGGRFSYKKYA